jgi:Spy/CpxP family protein refolding chaperone
MCCRYLEGLTMRWVHVAATLLLGLWLCEAVHAQDKPRFPFAGRLGGGGRLFLLSQESVQADLKLTDEQKAKIRSLQESQRQLFQDLRNLGREEAAKRLREQAEKTDKELAALLKPEQAKRLQQIQLQLNLRQGNYRTILTDQDIAEKIGLTDQQKEKIRQLDAEAAKLRESFQAGNREEIFKRFKELNSKYESILTDQQKAKLKELGGEPFTGEIRFGFGGGGQPGKPQFRPRKPAKP